MKVPTIDFNTIEPRHPTTPYNGQTNCVQTIPNEPDFVDTHQPFQQDCPPSLLELTT